MTMNRREAALVALAVIRADVEHQLTIPHHEVGNARLDDLVWPEPTKPGYQRRHSDKRIGMQHRVPQDRDVLFGREPIPAAGILLVGEASRHA
jgi:hypothetical protein